MEFELSNFLLGVVRSMKFELSSFLLGVVIGASIAFLTKLKALKSLSLDLKKLGFSLGVEGFEIGEKPDATGGVKIEGGNSGQTGDIAGRDIDKGIRYGPKVTLNQMIDNLSGQIQSIDKNVSKCYEQQSRLYEINRTDDINTIHREIQKTLVEGCSISSNTLLPFNIKQRRSSKTETETETIAKDKIEQIDMTLKSVKIPIAEQPAKSPRNTDAVYEREPSESS